MQFTVFGLLSFAVATTLGGLAGYVYRAVTSAKRMRQSAESETLEHAEETSDRSRELLLSIQQVADAIVAGVVAHGQQVRHCNSELHDSSCDVATVLAKLIQANDRMTQQLADAEERLQNQSALIDLHLAESRTDPLTGLSNRRALNEELVKVISLYESQGTPASVLMLDLDYFSKLNDSHGHLVGDDILRSVGQVLAQQARADDSVARFGGEEFAVILANTTSEKAKVIAERIRKSVSQVQCNLTHKPILISASAGLAHLLPGDSARTWLHRADQAVYFSKDSGRNCGYWNDGRDFKPFVQADRPTATPGQSPRIPALAVGNGAPRTTSDSEELLDPITQLLSTETFNKYFTHGLAHCRQGNTTMSMILIRVDRYHETSERYGISGDGLVLRIIGRLISSLVRTTDHVARYGNDSFAILFPHTNLATATEMAERIRAGVQKLTITLANEPLNFTVSIGAAQERGDDGSAPLIDRVRRAVGIAASRGGNLVAVSDGDGIECFSAGVSGEGRNQSVSPLPLGPIADSTTVIPMA